MASLNKSITTFFHWESCSPALVFKTPTMAKRFTQREWQMTSQAIKLLFFGFYLSNISILHAALRKIFVNTDVTMTLPFCGSHLLFE